MPNFPILFAIALIPLIIGAVWYNPKIGFGNAWMRLSDTSEEKMKGANMILIFGLTYLFSLFLTMFLLPVVIHQMGVFSTLKDAPTFDDGKGTGELAVYFQDFMARFGDRFRTFKHGALHGTMTGIFLALPVMGINAMFERKSWKYILLNAGFWIVCLALMGGAVCQWGGFN